MEQFEKRRRDEKSEQASMVSFCRLHPAFIYDLGCFVDFNILWH